MPVRGREAKRWTGRSGRLTRRTGTPPTVLQSISECVCIPALALAVIFINAIGSEGVHSHHEATINIHEGPA